MQRLDKILSDAGVATRKELRNIIRAGRVVVNGVTVRTPDEKFDEKSTQILVDGILIGAAEKILLMLHKPAGYVTSTADPRDKTVMELLPKEYARYDLKPIGRLDKETEGLLLFTNDGDLAHRIISPKTELPKIYLAEHDGEATEEDVVAFREGLVLRDGTQCRPAVLQILGQGKALVHVTEGKYHQVRRMMASRDLPVTYLKRVAEGGISLGDLALGECREVPTEAVFAPFHGEIVQ